MRTRIALAGALLTTAVVGPLAAAGHGAGTAALRCPHPSTAAVCDLLDQVAAQVEPLQAVLAPAGADLGVAGLPALAARPEGVPVAVVLGQATSVSGQIAALPEPVRSTPGVAELARSLDALIAAVGAPAGGAVGPASPARPAPAPAAAPRATSEQRSSSSFGGGASGPSSEPAPADRPAIPEVPVGDSLTFAPLALPDFGFDQGFDALAPSAPAGPSRQAPAELAVRAAAEQLPDGSSGTEVAVTVAAVVLLLGAAVALDVRKRTPAIPD